MVVPIGSAQFHVTDLLRQSVYSRLAGYEDLNDAQRLSTESNVSSDRLATAMAEIDRMIEKGADYSFAAVDTPDRGWVFCPEYGGISPLEISTGD